MSINVTLTALKAKLSEYVERVEKGESLQVTKHGEVVAELIPWDKRNWRDRLSVLPRVRQDGDLITPVAQELGWEFP